MAQTNGSTTLMTGKLTTLGIEFLANPLQTLCNNFHEYPFAEEEDSFSLELNNALCDLIALQKNGEQLGQLVHRLRIKLCQFDVWKYRAYEVVQDSPREYWNPLYQSYSDFCLDKKSVQTSRVDQSFPAQDILRDWSNAHIKLK